MTCPICDGTGMVLARRTSSDGWTLTDCVCRGLRQLLDALGGASVKRSPLKRKTPLRYRSAKRERLYVQRRLLVAVLLDERPICQYPRCARRSVDVHELLSRARGGSIVDRTNCVAICREHHDWITTHPAEAEATGWARHSWERAS